MGIYKDLDIELQELDMEIDFTNRDDLFDLVVDSKLAGVKLSRYMLRFVLANIFGDDRLSSLAFNEEFDDALGWHYTVTEVN